MVLAAVLALLGLNGRELSLLALPASIPPCLHLVSTAALALRFIPRRQILKSASMFQVDQTDQVHHLRNDLRFLTAPR
jgi:hypothetical protein